MYIKMFLAMLFSFSILISLTCTSPVLVSPGEKISSSSVSNISDTPAGIAKEAWEIKWDSVLSGARKEGRVVVLAGGSNVREPLSKGFKDRYGVDVEFMIGRGDEQVQRIFTERRNGIYYNDIYVSSPSMMAGDLKPAGALDPLDSTLVIPEVTDTKYWQNNKIPFFDKGHYLIQFVAYPSVPFAINTNFVRPGEIASYYDLLLPKWKDKLSINDPTVSGSGNNWFVAMLSSGRLDVDYFKKLVEQKPVIVRDQQLQMVWLSQGKYPLALTPKSDVLAQFENAGAPVKGQMVKEGTYLSAGGGVVAMFNKAPHPNAATLFINWLLSKEGITIYSKARGGEPSLRLDVPTDFIDPLKRPEPGANYFLTSEEYYLVDTPKYTQIAREVFKPIMP